MVNYIINADGHSTKTKMQKNLVRIIYTVVFGFVALMVSMPPASALATNVVYNNIPSPTPGNMASQPFEASGTSEFGGQVQLSGTDRKNSKITVLMSSWGCENGRWYTANCVTSPGASFNVPITLNIYDVGVANQPGLLLKSVTKTFDIPYRPSADNINCEGGRWYTGVGSECFNGFATPISFDLIGQGLTLPNKIILGIAYNTTHYGYSPVGESATCFTSSAGCGYDSLNVAVNDNGGVTPLVGSFPLLNSAYLRTIYGSCSSGAINPFGLDSGCWDQDSQPAIKIEASNLPTTKDQCIKDGWKSYGSTFKNQGDCVSYIATKGKNQPSGL